MYTLLGTYIMCTQSMHSIDLMAGMIDYNMGEIQFTRHHEGHEGQKVLNFYEKKQRLICIIIIIITMYYLQPRLCDRTF